MRILVVDDEPDLCEILSFNLENEGFEVECAYSAESALSLMADGSRFNLILLDVMLESMSGFDMARQLRAQGDNTPIVFLTALNAERELLEGFETGGDDYITKPFSFPTVLARVRAVLKRSESQLPVPDTEAFLEQGPFRIDMQRKSVALSGQTVGLTKKEFLILTLLLRHPGEHFTREQILDAVWEDDAYVGDRSVDVHIARLRKKLGAAGNSIVNHTGFGYVYLPSEIPSVKS